MKPAGAHHIAIQVVDLPRMEAFYTEIIGLSVARRWPATDGAPIDRSVWLDAGDGTFIALERVPPRAPEAEDPGRPGLHLLALRIAIAERSDWEARLAAAGAQVVHRTPFTLYVRDPEGNRVGLSHWPVAAYESAR